MSSLPPEVEAEMKRQAEAAKARSAGNNFVKTWSLTGKNAVIEAGKSGTIRLLPRWDYANSMVLDPTTQKRVPNPAYKPGFMYVYALEHWWEGPDGKTTREWCVRSKIQEPFTQCPICVAVDKLSKSAAEKDRKDAKRMQAREVWVFNAVVGFPRKVDQGGRADIRTLSLNGTQFWQVYNIMSSENPAFTRGDVTHPSKGYDLMFTRPVAGAGDRWKVEPAREPTSLYPDEQKKAFAGWVTMLIDLDKMLEGDRKDFAGLYQAYYGTEPSDADYPEEPAETGNGAEVEAPVTISAPAPTPEPAAAPPQGPDDDDFMPPPAQSAPAAQPQTAPKLPQSGRAASGRPGGRR